MSFTLLQYHAPDSQETRFQSTSEARLKPVPKDGVVPEGYHATTIYPKYFKVGGRRLLAEGSRVDCMAALRDGKTAAVEFRNLKAGEPVTVGRTEDASEGIYVYPFGFAEEKGEAETFAFRQDRSRETAYSMDYDSIYELLRHEKGRSRILRVMGLACTFDHDARAALAVLVRGGHVHGLLTDNALATHDLEASYFDTALGQNIHTQKSMPNGHYNHIGTLNVIRLCDSIAAFMEADKAKGGITYECVRSHIPYVLVGSIQDDGPLPEVYGNVYEGQDVMRILMWEVITVIYMASTLHTVATGNVAPSYRVADGVVRPVYFYLVDVSEFTVNEPRDRSSLSVCIITTNVQDFMVSVYKGVL